jgi:hypothetical protein
MKTRVRILVFLMSSLVFMSCLPGVAAAEKQFSPVSIVGETIYPDLQNGIDINLQETSDASSSLLKQWTCTIADNSNGTVTIYGETITFGNVDYLDVEVFLQRWNGSSWVDVTSRTYSDSSYFYVRGSSSIAITRGYSYRCRAVHHAQKADNNSTQTSVSNALLVQ